MRSDLDVLLDASNDKNFWIPCYLMELLAKLGSSMGYRFGLALREIAFDTKDWSTCKEESGDGWESLFLLVLFLRFASRRAADVDCLPDISFNVTDVSTLSALLFYNYPFPSDINIAKIQKRREIAASTRRDSGGL